MKGRSIKAILTIALIFSIIAIFSQREQKPRSSNASVIDREQWHFLSTLLKQTSKESGVSLYLHIFDAGGEEDSLFIPSQTSFLRSHYRDGDWLALFISSCGHSHLAASETYLGDYLLNHISPAIRHSNIEYRQNGLSSMTEMLVIAVVEVVAHYSGISLEELFDQLPQERRFSLTTLFFISTILFIMLLMIFIVFINKKRSSLEVISFDENIFGFSRNFSGASVFGYYFNSGEDS